MTHGCSLLLLSALSCIRGPSMYEIISCFLTTSIHLFDLRLSFQLSRRARPAGGVLRLDSPGQIASPGGYRCSRQSKPCPLIAHLISQVHHFRSPAIQPFWGRFAPHLPMNPPHVVDIPPAHSCACSHTVASSHTHAPPVQNDHSASLHAFLLCEVTPPFCFFMPPVQAPWPTRNGHMTVPDQPFTH